MVRIASSNIPSQVAAADSTLQSSSVKCNLRNRLMSRVISKKFAARVQQQRRIKTSMNTLSCHYEKLQVRRKGILRNIELLKSNCDRTHYTLQQVSRESEGFDIHIDLLREIYKEENQKLLEFKEMLAVIDEELAVLDDITFKKFVFPFLKRHHIISDMTCEICGEIMNQPALLNCGHLCCDFCIHCQQRHIKENDLQSGYNCPVCIGHYTGNNRILCPKLDNLVDTLRNYGVSKEGVCNSEVDCDSDDDMESEDNDETVCQIASEGNENEAEYEDLDGVNDGLHDDDDGDDDDNDDVSVIENTEDEAEVKKEEEQEDSSDEEFSDDDDDDDDDAATYSSEAERRICDADDDDDDDDDVSIIEATEDETEIKKEKQEDSSDEELFYDDNDYLTYSKPDYSGPVMFSSSDYDVSDDDDDNVSNADDASDDDDDDDDDDESDDDTATYSSEAERLIYDVEDDMFV